MKYILQKMKFDKGVHFGSGVLAESEYVIYADTIFSALCIEALELGGEEMLNQLVSYARNGQLCISDSLPYIDTDYYVPKPMLQIELDENDDKNDKKAAKSLKYISLDMFEDYLAGELDCGGELEIFSKMGKHIVRTQAVVRRDDDTLPYSVGVFHFSENAGLYICVGYESGEALQLINRLFHSLQFSGLGGKRKDGVGRFSVSQEEVVGELLCKLNQSDADQYMTLSCALPREDELTSVLENASYQLIKRSGFVQSENYSDSNRKKRDLYLFKSGACFKNHFSGDIYDVSQKGRHAVFRYAKPMFMGVSL